MKQGYLLSGLPASGKSTVAEIIADETGGDIIHAGGIIRDMWYDEHDDGPTSDELGAFAATKREQMGDGFFAEYAVGNILRGNSHYEYPLIVDSVRHMNEVNEFRHFLNTSELLWVTAPFETRFTRLKQRGRDDEEEFTEVDMLKRDERELYDLGVNTIYNHDTAVDRYINNSDDEDTLRTRIKQNVL